VALWGRRRLELSARARDDLIEIRAYIRQFDPAAAERVGSYLSAQIKRLQKFPELGVETQRPGFRVLQPARYKYRIYYAVHDDAVRILHVRHTSRESPDIKRL
jgi:toxin ParE1/3/4